MREYIINALNYPIVINEAYNLIDIINKDNVFVVTDSNIFAIYAKKFGLENIKNIYVMPAGEKAKTLNTIELMSEKMLESGCDRHTTVIALGGGVVGDTAGFLASVYMRGVKYIQIPTTLLSQVDSSIGGKTGVNLPCAKNSVGAFYSPESVIISLNFLETLPDREIICGIGEVIKTALLNEDIYAFAKNNTDKLIARDKDALFEAVKLCASHKAKVVAEDFREKGLRKTLNAGHTIGHALESADNYRLSHGEYVLNGLLYEMKLFEDKIDKNLIKSIESLIKSIINPFIIKDTGKIAALCVNDKKNIGGRISFMIAETAGKINEYYMTQGEVDDGLKRL